MLAPLPDDRKRAVTTRCIFAYGSLGEPEVMTALAGHQLASRAATLPGYRRLAVRGRPYPGVVKEPGASTPGVVWEGVDADTLALVDRFEGMLYQRRPETVRLDTGERLRAEVYVVPERHRAALAGAPWNREAFLSHHLAGYVEHCARLRRELAAAARPGP
jgi:gamma-glutamylcyclotransferase (GGCT)/AIG2-like uncharacterized protein YtfP